MPTRRKRRKNQKSDITVPELVETLRNSNLPNIIVEGKDDVIIYRTLVEDYFFVEDYFKEYVEIHQAGGRENLLRLYDELSDVEKQGDFRHRPVVFIADRDMWLFRGIPRRYENIIWTEGYSIENDLYVCAQLRDRVRDSDYEKVLDSICTWFAWKVKEYLCNNPPGRTFNSIRDEIYAHRIALSCEQIVPREDTVLASDLNSLPQEDPTFKKIRNNYNAQLRGKLLFELLVRFLKKPSKGFPSANINSQALYNDAITVPGSSKLFSRLKTEVQEKLKEQVGKITA